MKLDIINSFTGEYAFLSNMFPCTIKYKGLVFDCAEAAFQSQKKPDMANKFVGINGYAARKLGRKIKMSSNEIAEWNKRRMRIMSEVIWHKFHQNKELMNKLNKTGELILIECNSWRDTYWGMCDGKGQNNLGKILAMTRNIMIRIKTEAGVEYKTIDHGYNIQRVLDEYYDPAYALINGHIFMNEACRKL